MMAAVSGDVLDPKVEAGYLQAIKNHVHVLPKIQLD
jgi:hypothetical protein